MNSRQDGLGELQKQRLNGAKRGNMMRNG